MMNKILVFDFTITGMDYEYFGDNVNLQLLDSHRIPTKIDSGLLVATLFTRLLASSKNMKDPASIAFRR